MADAILDARDVRFSFGSNQVLRGIDLSVERGTVCCLMGMNGCGKSTFLDCVLGENEPQGGSILIDGADAQRLRAAERARLVAYVPQIHKHSFPYTVEHIVLMGRTVHQGAFGVPDDEDRELVARALALCGIERLAGRPCTSLSGGEMQMVLLARALVQDTPLIVLDEPTAHLDFRNELVFLETVERLVGESGVTVVMATHSPNQAFHLGSVGLDVRVALMSGGRIVRFGGADEVLDEQALARWFGVRARVVDVGPAGGGADVDGTRRIRQIVPLTSVPLPADGAGEAGGVVAAAGQIDGNAAAKGSGNDGGGNAR